MMLPLMPRCGGIFLDACKVLAGWSSEDEDGRSVRLAVRAA